METIVKEYYFNDAFLVSITEENGLFGWVVDEGDDAEESKPEETRCESIEEAEAEADRIAGWLFEVRRDEIESVRRKLERTMYW